MQTCQENLEILSAWLDGEADPREIEQLQEHLRQCPACEAARAAMNQVSSALRDESPEELDGISSSQMAASILGAPPARSTRTRLLPSLTDTGRFIAMPSLLIVLWSLLLVQHPWLFWVGWPLLGMVLFGAGVKSAYRPQVNSLRPWFESSLRPLGWTLTMLQFIPLSAVLASRSAGGLSWPLVAAAGPCLGLVAGAGVLFGMLRVAAPEGWSRNRLLPWWGALAVAVLTWLSQMATGLHWIGLALVGSGALALSLWSGHRVRQAMSDGILEVAGLTSLLPRYSVTLALVDATALGVTWVGGYLTNNSSQDLDKYMHHWLPGLTPGGWVWPLTLWFWVILWRTPLASLAELTQGRRSRWLLGAILGLLAGAAVSQFCFSGSIVDDAVVTTYLMSLLLGLAGAALGERPTTPDRVALLRQRLGVWLAMPLLLALGWVSLSAGFVALTPVPAEPVLAAQIREQSAQRRAVRPLPPGQNGYPFVQGEMARGLGGELPTVVTDQHLLLLWQTDRVYMSRLLSYFEKNLAHLEQCLERPGFQADYVAYNAGQQFTDALRVRALGFVQSGQIDRAIQDYVRILHWEARWRGANRAQGQHYLAGLNVTYAAQYLVELLNQQTLSASQCSLILKALNAYSSEPEVLVHALDDEFSQKVEEVLKNRGTDRFLLPERIYRRELGDFTTAYLLRRQDLVNGSIRPFPKVAGVLAPEWFESLKDRERNCRRDLTTLEGARARTALELYRCEHGHYPTSLAEVGAYLDRPVCDYLSPDGKFHYERNSQGIVLRGSVAPEWLPQTGEVFAPLLIQEAL